MGVSLPGDGSRLCSHYMEHVSCITPDNPRSLKMRPVLPSRVRIALATRERGYFLTIIGEASLIHIKCRIARPTLQVWVHWVVYNIPPDTKGLPENAGKGQLPQGALVGLNDFKRTSMAAHVRRLAGTVTSISSTRCVSRSVKQAGRNRRSSR